VLWFLKPARKGKGVLSTGWDSTLNECQPGFYRCGGTTTVKSTNRASTGVVGLQQSANRASTGVAGLQQNTTRASTGVAVDDEQKANRASTGMAEVCKNRTPNRASTDVVTRL
jgi:hypothetical protein